MAFDFSKENNPLLWKCFSEISSIPRASGQEALIRNYLIEKAKALGCSYFVDKTGNVLMRKEADNGYESVPTVILQGHMDMVCEKRPGVEGDFRVSLAVEERDGKRWLHSETGSMGGDNGIAVAMGLTLLKELKESKKKSGAIELVFTVDEECGLTGALGLDSSFLKGKQLINLDSEEEGEFVIGCAGGETFEFKRQVEKVTMQSELNQFELRVSGLLGGHSGVNIDKGRINAIKFMGRVIKNLTGNKAVFSIIDWQSQFKHNVIPSEAKVVLAWEGEIPSNFVEKTLSQLQTIEPTAEFSITKLDRGAQMGLSSAFSSELIEMLEKIPYGVISPGEVAVKTSANPCKLVLNEGQMEGEISFRSLEDEDLYYETQEFRQIMKSYGWNVKGDGGYPCWTPNFESPWVQKIENLWKDFTSVAPKIGVIHAGLECGVLGKKIENCEMISLGPNLFDVHSPSERLEIESAEKVYSFVKLVISSMSLSVC